MSQHMGPTSSRALSILRWTGLLIAGAVLGAFVGGALGSYVGGRIGSPEGEGFIGFLYGIYVGPVVGLVMGALVALRISRGAHPTRRRTGVVD